MTDDEDDESYYTPLRHIYPGDLCYSRFLGSDIYTALVISTVKQPASKERTAGFSMTLLGNDGVYKIEPATIFIGLLVVATGDGRKLPPRESRWPGKKT